MSNSPLPSPISIEGFYLAAILDELRGISQALTGPGLGADRPSEPQPREPVLELRGVGDLEGPALSEFVAEAIADMPQSIRVKRRKVPA